MKINPEGEGYEVDTNPDRTRVERYERASLDTAPSHAEQGIPGRRGKENDHTEHPVFVASLRYVSPAERRQAELLGQELKAIHSDARNRAANNVGGEQALRALSPMEQYKTYKAARNQILQERNRRY